MTVTKILVLIFFTPDIGLRFQISFALILRCCSQQRCAIREVHINLTFQLNAEARVSAGRKIHRSPTIPAGSDDGSINCICVSGYTVANGPEVSDVVVPLHVLSLRVLDETDYPK